MGLGKRREGRNHAKPSEAQAKTMRSPSEVQANNTLSMPDPCAVTTLLTGFGVAGSARAGKVGHSRIEEAENIAQPFLSLTP